ncbi:unnamed protein product [Mytilus edulis]|uniref:C-type lectin domain-containing protein n=1 Tax=Mytilus edulis TaxID=6550 RepID=A0A8S3PMI1_MYTED|nr:unnamed protein product [Mytilus edulis]
MTEKHASNCKTGVKFSRKETAFVDGSGLGTGSDFGLLPIPLLALALLMIPMIMMPMMSSVTSESSVAVAPYLLCQHLFWLLFHQHKPLYKQQVTPCVPTNCPAGYRLLNDQTASPNCYQYSDTSQLRWSEALTACANTPGAYLWKPNDEKEADAVRSLFAFGTNVDIWIGANSPLHNGNYEYAVAGGALSLTNLPFGTLFADNTQEDCIEIEVNGNNTWEWDDESCDNTYRYICEVPRSITTKTMIKDKAVPANWDYLAVEFMREAAIKAGIGSRQLAIVSEPEAASMYCQVVNSHLHDTQQKNSFETQFKSGKMFMMVDLGTKSLWQKMEIAVEKSPYRDSVNYSKQKIHIMPDTFRDLFKPTIEALVEHLETMFRQAELRDLKTIVMVGGFSECELVQHKVMERFGRNITIIISEKAGPAISKGAVLYGHSMKL